MPDGADNLPLTDAMAAAQSRAPAAVPGPAAPTPVIPTLYPTPEETARDPKAVAAARYRGRVLLVLAGLALAFGLYWGSSYVFAYTDDAYVTSDLVAVAPQITGRVVAVPVVDNQTVTRGMLLAAIDPQPFKLALDEQTARRVEAQAQLAVDHDLIKSAKAARDSAAAKEQMATDNLRRARPVAAAGFVSRQALEDAATQAQAATAALADAEAVVASRRQERTLHEAAIKTITAQIAYLQWQLDQTRVLAPVDGAITNLTLRVGDEAVANRPLIGVVDAHAWRILANYKESVIRHMRVGHPAWVWLDTYPWHMHWAVIQGIARGISRNPDQIKLLPYVAPTTDWIRLEQRFPVTLVLRDPDPSVTLHMGADARTLIIY